MRTQLRTAAVALVSVWACVQATAPATGGRLALLVERGDGVAALDSGRVLVRGPTNQTVTVMPGATVSIDGLASGTYTVALEGFDSGGVARFFATTGVTVVAGQMTTVAAPPARFASFVPTMMALPPSGMSTRFTVTYDSVSGAASYEVEAATDQAFSGNRVAIPAVHTSAQVTVATPGTYYVRVRAIDTYGARGRASPFQTVQLAAPPTIVVTPSSRSFSATQGGGTQVAQTVAVTNGGGGTLSGLSAAVTYTTGQPTGWLAASLNTTTAPSTLTLTATTGSLNAGTYTATVSVTSALASNSPQMVSATFTVAAPPPAIVLSRTSITFNGKYVGADPPSQTVSVTNGGGGTVNGLSASVVYGSGQPTGWLAASLSSTTAPSTLTLTATTGLLLPGTYTATVSVASPVVSNSPQTVSITFTVAPT